MRQQIEPDMDWVRLGKLARRMGVSVKWIREHATAADAIKKIGKARGKATMLVERRRFNRYIDLWALPTEGGE